MEGMIIGSIFIYKNISRIVRSLRVPIFIYTDCKFHPSCSDYAIEAVSKYGAARGSVLALKRIFRCSPFSKGGVDLP